MRNRMSRSSMKRLLLVFLLFNAAFAALGQFGPPAEAEIEVAIVPEHPQAGSPVSIEVTYTFPEDYHQTLQEDFFYFELENLPGFRLMPIEYPEGVPEDGLVNYYGTVILGAVLEIDETIGPGTYPVTVRAHYQLCDENGTCFFPQEAEFTLDVTVTEGVKSILFLGLLQFILFAFIGGVILNIMPCVLPLLSVRALSLVRESHNEKRRIFFSSMFYTGGIITAFLTLAALVVALKASGELVGWGFQFQNPGFVIALTAVIYVFALAMFDVYIITAPGMTGAAKASGRGGYLGSFLTGVFAVIVATPCTAPFLGTALGFAFSQPPFIIFLIFFFIGLGLALPFILLGIWPSLMKHIPKPGNWMNIFKEVMGFLLIATAIYLVNTLIRQIGADIIRVLMFLGILTFSAWLYGRFARPGASRRRRLLVLITAAAISIFGGFATLSSLNDLSPGIETGTELKKGWEEFSPELVSQYRSEGYPVFIDFYAEWCTNCKVNEARVLTDREVLKVFQEKNTKLLKGDFTLNDPVIAEWIRKFGKGGVPVYALYLPGRKEPIVFPELLTKTMVIGALLDGS